MNVIPYRIHHREYYPYQILTGLADCPSPLEPGVQKSTHGHVSPFSPEMPYRETTCEMSLIFWKHLVCTAAKKPPKPTCRGIIDMFGKFTNQRQTVIIPPVQTKM